MRTLGAACILAMFVLLACRKEPNPFAVEDTTASNPSVEQLPQGNFAWLHQRIFKPTCAQSGCHDGTFEPEFRTISGAYNSLVFHPVITNDQGGNFTYRVVPGDVDASLLHERMTVFIPNTSGIMPLSVPPGSDWPLNNGSYIDILEQWIISGAPDMFGNLPDPGDLEPQVIGLLAFPAGAQTGPYPRGTDPGVQPIEVPAVAIDVWFAFQDDAVAPLNLQYNKFKISTSSNAFDTVPEQPLVVGNGPSGPDFGGATTVFTHKAAIDLAGAAPGTYYFLRTYVNDGAHTDPTEVPDDGTGPPMKDYFTLIVVP